MSRATLSELSSFYVILPILAGLYGIALFIYNRRRLRERATPAERILLAVLLLCYLALYLYLTLYYRRPRRTGSMNPELFWSYREAFSLSGGGLIIRRKGLARQILLNILVDMPLGFLLPLVFHRRKHPYLLAVLAAFLLSALTEITQYFTHRGLCELDDVFNNTLGCALGAALFALGAAWLRQRSNPDGKKESD